MTAWLEHADETHMHKLWLFNINNDIFLLESPWKEDNSLIAVHISMAQSETASTFGRKVSLLFNGV